MQEQPTRRISPEIHKITTDSHVKRNSQSSSSRSSTSSWTEEPVITVNMDIMTGHLILVRRLLKKFHFFVFNIFIILVLYGRSST